MKTLKYEELLRNEYRDMAEALASIPGERCVNPISMRAEGWDSADLPGMRCGGFSIDQEAIQGAG